MLSKPLWTLLRLSRRIWVRSTLIALLAVLAAVAAWALGPLIPESLAKRFGEEAVMPILQILANSMLVVVTFSLSVMVAAFRQASAQMTPRAQRLLLEDTTAQGALATFLGAFIFALTAIVLFRADVYGGRAPVVVFGVACLVMVLVILAILRWIAHLSTFGSLDDTMRQLENRAEAALREHRRRPAQGGVAFDAGSQPSGLVPVRANRTGYVQHVDLQALQTCARDHDAAIWVAVQPGDWLGGDGIVAEVDDPSPAIAKAIDAAYSVGPVREFDGDPRFGLLVLAEIAERALSPGVNDPGTAIEVIGRIERLLTDTQPRLIPPEPPKFDRVRVRRLTEVKLIGDAIDAIARDGAGSFEVSMRLLGLLRRMSRWRDAETARAASALFDRALALAVEAEPVADRRDRLQALHKDGAE